MNGKISVALLVFCAVQGLHAYSWTRPTGVWGNSAIPSLNSPNSNRLTNCLSNGINAFREAREAYIQTYINAIQRGVKQEIAKGCVMEQMPELQKFADSFVSRLDEILEGIEKEEALSSEAKQEMRAEMKTWMALVAGTPGQIAALLQSNANVQKIAETFQATRDEVTVKTVNLLNILKKYVPEDSPLHETGKALQKEMLLMGFTKAEEMKKSVEECVKNRTPSKYNTQQ